MKKLGILILMFLMLGLSIQAQEKTSKEDRKKAKMEKKAEQEKMIAQTLDSITSLMDNKTFALEADMIRNRSYTYNVFQQNNFIKVDGNEVIIQTANPSQVGANGLGGITVRGSLLNYEVVKDKKSVGVNMMVSTFALGNLTINLSTSGSGNATAFIRGNFGLRATFVGDIAALDDLDQYQGMTQF